MGWEVVMTMIRLSLMSLAFLLYLVLVSRFVLGHAATPTEYDATVRLGYDGFLHILLYIPMWQELVYRAIPLSVVVLLRAPRPLVVVVLVVQAACFAVLEHPARSMGEMVLEHFVFGLAVGCVFLHYARSTPTALVKAYCAVVYIHGALHFLGYLFQRYCPVS